MSRIKQLLCFTIVMTMLVVFISCGTNKTSEEQETTAKITTKTSETTKKTTTKKQTTKEETTKKTTEVEKNPLAEKYEITWLKIYTQAWEEGRWDELELEDKFNVDLKVWNVYFSPSDLSQVDMMLAAGDCPDFGYYYKSGRELIEQDLARTVPKDMIEKYFPSYAAILNDNPVGWKYNKVVETDDFYKKDTDEYYGLTMLSPNANFTRNLACWRLDWLENIGYSFDNLAELPVDYSKLAGFAGKDVPDGMGKAYMTNRVFSFDEVNEIYRSFTEDDPDGNGQDDTYAAIYSPYFFSRPIYGMFGIDLNSNCMFKDELTGNVVPYFAHPGYRDYMAWTNEMLSKGYMRELPGIEDAWWTDYGAAWNTGKVGFMSCTLERFMSERHQFDDPQINAARIVETNNEARFLLTQVPDGPGYEGANITYWVFPFGGTYIISKECKDGKLQRLLSLLEYAYYGENWTRYKFGIEGVHYKWMGEPFESAMVNVPSEKIPEKYAGPTGAPRSMFGNDNFSTDLGVNFGYTSNPLFYSKFMEENGWFDSDVLRPYKYYHSTTMPADKYEEFKEIKENTNDSVNKVVSDFNTRVAEGQIADISSEWSSYIDQLYENGLDQWVEIFNDEAVPTYDEFNSK